MMNILVTSGVGFIGSNFIRHELENHTEDSIDYPNVLTYVGN